MDTFIKNNYMKLAAGLIWFFGFLAGIALAFRPEVTSPHGQVIAGAGAIPPTATEYNFSIGLAFGWWVLFASIGFVAFLLAINYHSSRPKVEPKPKPVKETPKPAQPLSPKFESAPLQSTPPQPSFENSSPFQQQPQTFEGAPAPRPQYPSDIQNFPPPPPQNF